MRHRHLPDVLSSNPLAHLIQLLDQLADAWTSVLVVSGLSQTFDVDKLLLVLVHVMVTRLLLALPVDAEGHFVDFFDLPVGQLLQFLLGAS